VGTLFEVDETLLIQPGQIGLYPDPSTHQQAQGDEEDRTTMLRVMDFGEFGSAVFDPEAQTRRELKAKAPQRRAELAQCR